MPRPRLVAAALAVLLGLGIAAVLVLGAGSPSGASAPACADSCSEAWAGYHAVPPARMADLPYLGSNAEQWLVALGIAVVVGVGLLVRRAVRSWAKPVRTDAGRAR